MTATTSASAAGDVPVKDMLPLGLKPQKICDMLFASVSGNDLMTYLACTGSVTREERSVGTFKCTDWETGRELHRKYKTRYVYLRERDVEGEEGVACDVTYLPQFGPVAGYREGATFEYIDHRGDKQKRNVIVRMRKETLRWGEPAEWRVAGVDYGAPPEFL